MIDEKWLGDRLKRRLMRGAIGVALIILFAVMIETVIWIGPSHCDSTSYLPQNCR